MSSTDIYFDLWNQHNYFQHATQSEKRLHKQDVATRHYNVCLHFRFFQLCVFYTSSPSQCNYYVM